MTILRLDETVLRTTANKLARRDPALAAVLHRCGPPPLWQRPTTFATLVRIVLEQQVSLAAAKSTFHRLRIACGGRITAPSILRLGDERLRSCGLSRQKARYVGELAGQIAARRFSVAKLSQLDDAEVALRIKSQLGFGAWSADIYLMMALLRPDILPIGDLGLVKGIAEVCDEPFDSIDSIVLRCDRWRPWRSVATRMIWQGYLLNRGKDIATIASG